MSAISYFELHCEQIDYELKMIKDKCKDEETKKSIDRLRSKLWDYDEDLYDKIKRFFGNNNG